MIKVLDSDAAVAVAVSSTSLILMWCWRAIGIIFVCPHFCLVSPNGASGKGLNECVLQFRRIHKVNFCQDTSSNGFPRLIFLSPFSQKWFPILQISRVETGGKIVCVMGSLYPWKKEAFFLFVVLFFIIFTCLGPSLTESWWSLLDCHLYDKKSTMHM